LYKKNITTLIFDLDGTLIDTGRDIANAMNLTLSHYNCPQIKEDRCIELVGDGIIKLVSRAFGEVKHNDINYKFDSEFLDPAVDLYRQIYHEHMFDTTKPYSGTVEVLTSLKNNKLAVISNKDYKYTLEILQYFKLDQYFQIILGGDSLEYKKPHPEPLLHVMEKLNSSPEETMMIGDTDKDIRSGKAANVTTCAALYGMRSEEELKLHQPDYFIDDISKLLTIIYLF